MRSRVSTRRFVAGTITILYLKGSSHCMETAAGSISKEDMGEQARAVKKTLIPVTEGRRICSASHQRYD